MSNNLPPGVTGNMLPGDRPEDAIYDRIFERLPEWMQQEIESDTAKGKKINRKLWDMIPRLFSEDDLLDELNYIATNIDDNGNFK